MTDYIRREDALKALYNDYAYSAMDVIKKLPAADVAEVVHAEWQGEGDGYADGALVYDVWQCSNCGYCADDGTDDAIYLPKYCPNCGAKMDGGINNVSD